MSLRVHGHSVKDGVLEHMHEKDEPADEGDDDLRPEEDDEAAEEDEAPAPDELPADSLQVALHELIAEVGHAPGRADVVVGRLMRSLALRFSTRGSSVQVDDNATAASLELEDDGFTRVREAVGYWLMSTGAFLPRIIDVVTSDDFEASIGDSQLTERVLRATTRWERWGLDHGDDVVDEWRRDTWDDDEDYYR